jgi:hypothetical protein
MKVILCRSNTVGSALEAGQTRALREVALGITASQTYLSSINDKITALRATLQS